MTPETSPPAWVQLVPLVFYSMITLGISLWLAPRKGISRWVSLIALFPCFGSLFVMYILAQTDKAVLDEIADLKRRLASLEEKPTSPPPIP